MTVEKPKREYIKETVIETTERTIDKDTKSLMTKISMSGASKEISREPIVKSLPPIQKEKEPSVVGKTTPQPIESKTSAKNIPTSKKNDSDDDDEIIKRKNRRKFLDDSDDEDIKKPVEKKAEEKKERRKMIESDDEDTPVSRVANKVIAKKEEKKPEKVEEKKVLTKSQMDEFEERIKLMQEAHEMYVKQIELDHQKQLKVLAQKQSSSPKQDSPIFNEQIKKLTEAKTILEEKLKIREFEAQEANKAMKKTIDDLEIELTKMNPLRKKGSLLSSSFESIQKTNLLHSELPDGSEREDTEEVYEAEDDEEDVEDVKLQKKKELEEDLYKLKANLMTLELMMGDLDETNVTFVIKTLVESLGLKELKETDGVAALKEVIDAVKGMLRKKEKLIPEFDPMGGDIIDFCHDVVNEFATLDNGIKMFTAPIEPKKAPVVQRDDFDDDLPSISMITGMKPQFHLQLENVKLQKSSDSFKEFERRFSTLAPRKFNTSQFPQKAYQSSEIPSAIMNCMRTKFKVHHPDGGLLGKTKIFLVDQFTKQVCLVDKKGAIKKALDGNMILFLEKNLLDVKRLRITFLTGPKDDFELVFSGIEERERFFECVSAVRAITAWSPWMTVPSSEISNVVIHDKLGTVAIEASFEKFEPIKVYCGTWNMGVHPAPINYRGFDELFPDGMDIITIAFQESDSGITKYVQEYFERAYFTIATLTLWEIRLLVLAKNDHLSKITCIQQGSKATGFMNMLGNKGGLGISFKFNETSLCFVGCHLAAHEERIQTRNQNVGEIVQNLKLGNPDLDISQFDHVFWMGDMNYRIDLPYSLGVKWASDKQFAKLVATDQLRKEMGSDEIFEGFKEGDINFIPSYKFDLGNRKYAEKKARTPSYCDRVLYKTNTSAKIRIISYESPSSITTSDHSPVYAQFEVQTLRPILSFLSEVRPRSIILDDIYISGRSSTLLKQPHLSVYGTFFTESPHHAKKSTGKKTANPGFGSFPFGTIDVVKFEPEYLKTQHIIFTLRDLSLGTKVDDTIIGYASLSLEKACDDNPLEFSIPLVLHTKKIGKLNGICHVKVKNMMM